MTVNKFKASNAPKAEKKRKPVTKRTYSGVGQKAPWARGDEHEDDVDGGDDSLHHTLGANAGQAASGMDLATLEERVNAIVDYLGIDI